MHKYIFFCENKRQNKRCCGSLETENYFNHFKQIIIDHSATLMQSNIIAKVNKTGCMSKCGYGPTLVIFPENIWYRYDNIDDLNTIFQSHFIAGKVCEKLLIKAPGTDTQLKY